MPSFKLGKMTLRSLFKKPITTSYPAAPITFNENVRGHIENDMEKCILCGVCQRNCPSGALTVDRKAGTWSIDRFACVQCKYCVQTCPTKSLSMKNTYTKPAGKKTIETYDKIYAPGESPEEKAAAKAAAKAKAEAEKAKKAEAEE